MAFILLCDLSQHGRLPKLWKMISLKYFRLLWSASSRFSVGAGADQFVIYENNDSMFYSCVSDGFYFALGSTSAWGIVQTYGNCSILSIFSHLGLFSNFLGRSKRGLRLDLHEMTRVSHAVACSIVFILLCDLGRHEKILKLRKNDHI